MTSTVLGCGKLGFDINTDYVNQLNTKRLVSYEPNVETFLKESTCFRASTSLKEGLDFSSIIYILEDDFCQGKNIQYLQIPNPYNKYDNNILIYQKV
jgi:UDP-glucose 6-dehydrogenase